MYLKQQILRVVDDSLLIDTLSMHFIEASKSAALIRSGIDDKVVRRHYELNDEITTLADDELTRRAMVEGGINKLDEVIE